MGADTIEPYEYVSNSQWLPRLMCSDLFDPQTFRCLVVGLKEDRSLDTREESLAAILDAAARRKTRRNQLGRTARDFRTRIAKWIVVEVGIFENVL